MACAGVGGIPDGRYKYIYIQDKYKAGKSEKDHSFFSPFRSSQAPAQMHNLVKKINDTFPVSCYRFDLKEPLPSSHTFKLKEKEIKK